MAKNGAGSEPVGIPINLRRILRINFQETVLWNIFYSSFTGYLRITIIIHLPVVFDPICSIIKYMYYQVPLLNANLLIQFNIVKSFSWGILLNRAEKSKPVTNTYILLQITQSTDNKTKLLCNHFKLTIA